MSFTDIQIGLSQGVESGLVDADRIRVDSIALVNVEKVLVAQPNHIEALLDASQLAAHLGGTTASLSIKMLYVEKATYYAQRSIHIVPDSKKAHLNYIVALGLHAEIAKGPTEKLKQAKIIKTEVDYLLSLDSLYPEAHFALGKWHLSLASLSWIERTACEFLYGGMPKEASLETALFCFERAIQLKPDCILFYYNKALALHKLERKHEAIRALKFSLLLPLQDPYDPIRRHKCISLLNQL